MWTEARGVSFPAEIAIAKSISLVFETAAPSVIASLSLLTIFKLKYTLQKSLSLQGIWEAYLLASDSAASFVENNVNSPSQIMVKGAVGIVFFVSFQTCYSGTTQV